MPLPTVPSLGNPALEEWAKALLDAIERDLYQSLRDNGGVGLNTAAVNALVQPQIQQAADDAVTEAIASSTATGSIWAYGGTTAPPLFLLCDGALVEKATYPALYGVLGSTFGPETGTHFYLPNLQQRVPRGAGTVGETSGADVVSISGVTPHEHQYNQASANSTIILEGSGSAITVLVPPVGQTLQATTNVGSAQSVTVTNPYLMVSFIIRT